MADSLPTRIPELDGFRALAVWMVLFDHLIDGWHLPKEAHSWMPWPLWQFVSHGWLGVDVFFVLSGFLITGILLDTREKPHYFRNFYGRRALRIIPLYFTCIGVMWLCYGGKFFLLALLFLANFYSAFGVPTPHGPEVFWSLAIEEHFYLLWPLAVRFMTRRALLVTAAAIVVGSPILRAWAYGAGYSTLGIYEFSFYRFDGLALGAILALWARSRFFHRRGAWTLAAILLTVAGAATLATIPFNVFGTGTLAGTALRSTQAQAFFASSIALAIAYHGTILTAPLRWGFAKLSADYSFCIYLVHLSLGDLYYWTLREFHINEITRWGPVGALGMRTLAIVLSSFAVAALSHRYLEVPFMNLRRHFV